MPVSVLTTLPSLTWKMNEIIIIISAAVVVAVVAVVIIIIIEWESSTRHQYTEVQIYEAPCIHHD